MPIRRLAPLAAAGLFAIAACADSDDPGSAAPATDAPAATESSAATDAAPTTTTTGSPAATDAVPTTTTAAATTTGAPTTTAATATTTSPPSEVEMAGSSADDANVAELQRFLADAADGDGEDRPFYMVNLIRFREQAEYPDGRPTDLTGEEANAIYGEYMVTTKLPEIGAENVYLGDVEQDLIGSSDFDQIAVVRYPSRSAFAEMTQDPEFQEMGVHKQAGVLDTVVLATEPIDVQQPPGPDEVPFPATDDDPPFAFVHVLDFHETAQYEEGDDDADPTRSGRDAVMTYGANAGTVAGPLGVRVAGWFEVKATIIGPADTWEEVRINTFPSHTTFAELTSDPTWQAGVHHREAGIADTYAIMNLPRVNTLDGVVAER